MIADFAFMPNKLDLIRDIALGTDNAERKAYSNNKYGLVEYSIRSGYVKISYKNRNGVRKEGALDWRELYEILSYMVKQPFYCGEDQKKYYQETKQKADRNKMNPVHKRFFDIEDSVKANRLETRERAIANGWMECIWDSRFTWSMKQDLTTERIMMIFSHSLNSLLKT